MVLQRVRLSLLFGAGGQLRPMNITGPVLSKVIPWNLETAQYPESVHRDEIKPGYMLDLRVLQMSRFNPPRWFEHSPQERRDTPIRQIKSLLPEYLPDISYLPLIASNQLCDPVEENLYIASYVNPLKVRDCNQFYPYHIHYISTKELDSFEQLDLKNGQVIDLNGLNQTIDRLKNALIQTPDSDEIKTQLNQERQVLAAQSLARFYRNAGVQAGALNPEDVLGQVSQNQVKHAQVMRADRATVCMVANLMSFL